MVRKSARRERKTVHHPERFIVRECVFLLPVHFSRRRRARAVQTMPSDAANDTRARGASHAPRTEERRNKAESFERRRPYHLLVVKASSSSSSSTWSSSSSSSFSSISMVVLNCVIIKSFFVQQKKMKRNEMK